MKLQDLSIGTRLAVGFGAMLLFATAIAGIGVWRLGHLADTTREMMGEPLKKERLEFEWARNIDVAVARTAVITRSSDLTLGALFAKDQAATSKASAEVIKQLEPMLTEPAEKEAFKTLMQVRKVYTEARDGAIKLKEAGKFDEAAAALENQYLPLAKKYHDIVTDLAGLQRANLDQRGQDLQALTQATRMWIVGLWVAVSLLGLLLAVALTRGITGPLRHALGASRRVAQGDLTRASHAQSRDEPGQLLGALGDMSAGLARLVTGVRQSAGAISGASSEIADGTQNLSSRTEQQASSLQETAASMNELTGTVKRNADNARQANRLAEAASAVAVEGGAVVGQAVDTMSSISQSSRKIEQIIGVIDGIAFQTNILALNAAVEAARAGEQGRGFAVVASEVRNLAQRSAAAAKEIKGLINDSVGNVDAGTELVSRAGRTMEDVVASIKKVSDIMGEIAAASQEQTLGIEQVNQAIAQMDQATQQNAALVEQAAAAAQSMREQAGALVQAVAAFKTEDTAAQLEASRAIAMAQVTSRSPVAGLAGRVQEY